MLRRVAPPRPSRPTDAELVVLRILWAKGPSTVRQVYEALTEDRELGYTTALKVLQVMTDKGLTTREPLGAQQHVYRARYSETQTQRQLLKDLVERAFGGSMSQLFMQALATKKPSSQELRAIRRLLALDVTTETDRD